MRVVLDKSTSATHLTSTSYGYGLERHADVPVPRASSPTAAACPATDRSCAGFPTTASASSPSATSPTPAGTMPSARRSIGWTAPAACGRARSAPSAALVAARDDVSKLVVALGRRAGRQDCRGEPVPGPVEGPAAQGDRRSPRQGRRVLRPDEVRRRRERAARAVDDELRARRAAGGDHARADDSAGRSVPGGSSGARAAAGCGAVRVLLNHGHTQIAEATDNTDNTNHPGASAALDVQFLGSDGCLRLRARDRQPHRGAEGRAWRASVAGDHARRSAAIGSSRAARSAGARHASVVTASSVRVTAA